MIQLAGSAAIPGCEKVDGTISPTGSNERNQDSNHSWDLDWILVHNPKMARLLKSHSSNMANVLSYHGMMGMIDKGLTFA